MIDIYHSRRDKYKVCQLFGKCDNGALDEYVVKNKPIDTFFAREVTNRDIIGQNIQGSFYTTRNTVMLETTDEIRQILEGFVVLYMGQTWVVDSVRQEIHQKETEFSNCNHYTTYINIRR